MWIYRLMLMLQRNVLSPSSGAEVTRQRNTGLLYDLKSKG
jgi:hypothetical protein